MMMDQKCPYCGAEMLLFTSNDDEWVSDTECIRTWNVECGCCKKNMIVSEVLTVTSRLVAKDCEELDELIKKETEEERR